MLLALAALAPLLPYVFVNRAPGVAWNQNRPESISGALFTEPAAAAGNGSRARFGVSFILSYFGGPREKVEESLRRLLTESQRQRVPVLISLDGQNWWDARPELWNWWDSKLPGYDPANRENVEWTGWSPEHAVRIGWRNWGRQIRVRPAPNVAAPRFRAASKEELTRLVRIVRDWEKGLPATDKWLFGGVKVGWEASVGINAYHYPGGNSLLDRPASEDPTHGLDMAKGLSGGLAPLGYAALTSMRRTHGGEITRRDHDLIVADYLAFLSRTCRQAGLPRAKIYTHAGGQFAPYELHSSHRVAINRESVPGWSLYNVAPAAAGDLAASLGRGQDWCAAEWLPAAKTASEWEAAYRTTLDFRRCHFVCLYNWETIRGNPEAIAGLRRALGSGTMGFSTLSTTDVPSVKVSPKGSRTSS